MRVVDGDERRSWRGVRTIVRVERGVLAGGGKMPWDVVEGAEESCGNAGKMFRRGIVAGGKSGKRRGQAREGDGGERGGGRTRGLREDGTSVEMGRGSAEGGRCREDGRKRGGGDWRSLREEGDLQEEGDRGRRGRSWRR